MEWLKNIFRPKRPNSEVAGAFERIRTLMTDETEQNQYLPPGMKPRFSTPVDQWPNARGDFGRSRENPIPVNGPLGEVLYLSQLRTPGGVPFLFHRAGAVEVAVDQYELVSLDASQWEVLYLDMYSTRKSAHVPSGLKRDTTLSTYPFIFGVSSGVSDFPRGMREAIGASAPIRSMLLLFKPSLIETALAKHAFVRPPEHLRRLVRGRDVTSQIRTREPRSAPVQENLHTMPSREFPAWFPSAWSAAGNHLGDCGGDELVFLRANLNPPVFEHLSFRFGNQLYFVWIDVGGEPALEGGIRELFLRASDGANAHPCVLELRRTASGYEPAEPGWGLVHALDGRPVDPNDFDPGDLVEMTDWEVHDMGVQTVADWLRKQGARNISRQSNFDVDPSIWFQRDRGPEYAVVRAVRYPEAHAPRPRNLAATVRQCRQMSSLGHFASVAVAADESEEDLGRLIRGERLSVRFAGLESLS